MNFKKANVIIITLFMTILVAIIWLITTKYIINLLNISSENKKYYKAYYIAYAWLELELLKDKNHWYGFEDKISSWSDTVSKNFTGINYYFSSNIFSRSKYITNSYKSLFNTSITCDDKSNWIVLNTWDSLLIPLFYDKNVGEWNISGHNYNSYDITNANLYYDGDIRVVLNKKIDFDYSLSDIKNVWTWVSAIWTDTLSLNHIVPSTIDVWSQPFLIVWSNEISKVCLDNTTKVVSPYTDIVSEWRFMDRTVTVKVIKEDKWAQFSTFGVY